MVVAHLIAAKAARILVDRVALVAVLMVAINPHRMDHLQQTTLVVVVVVPATIGSSPEVEAMVARVSSLCLPALLQPRQQALA